MLVGVTAKPCLGCADFPLTIYKHRLRIDQREISIISFLFFIDIFRKRTGVGIESRTTKEGPESIIPYCFYGYIL